MGSRTGRTAPAATETGTRGQARFSPLLSEWLMGLPKGFVTNVGLPYSAQHRALATAWCHSRRWQRSSGSWPWLWIVLLV